MFRDEIVESKEEVFCNFAAFLTIINNDNFV
jgi:hypothetical protein